MNTINFNLLNGLPMNQAVLDRLQKAYSMFNALGNIVGEKTIISGCTVSGSTVSDGVVFVNGEVFNFKGGIVSPTVRIKEDVTNLTFKDDNAYPVVKTRYLEFGSGVGAIDWADFKRGFATKDIVAGLLGKADQSSFDALSAAFVLVYEKMLTIDVGAEKNVQPNWTQADDTKDDFIKNKPSTISVLKKGVFAVADFAADSLQTVTFPTVGTNNYMVVGSMVSIGTNYDNDNDVIWMVREKTNSSFKLTLRELGGAIQNLSFEYMLIPLT
ncbi:hypothetical protein [Flavobacterium sp. TAB 87]|uniref:hypothetical protein n=1 Tax=Flavobacterium sp. TAB 87 TaxID=1729581 RepID=UPI00076DADCA|nr:hypothetical protein [Flavobacterium sp. TAB 87]KVV16148.1 hypothetical protein AP058_00313 [Flavobacterium sp. TAB 87]